MNVKSEKRTANSLTLAATAFSLFVAHSSLCPAGLAEGPPTPPPRQGVAAPAAPKIAAPSMAEGVLRALEAAYLSDDERADLRVFHGAFTQADLKSPARRAPAALIAGVYDDASLFDPAASVLDRAEAALIRGEPEQTLELIKDGKELRAIRLRAQALEALGRIKEADAAVQPAIDLLVKPDLSAADVTDGVGAAMVRGRIRGMGAGDVGKTMQLLGEAQQSIDRLYWPAILGQARVLTQRSKEAEAQKAAMQVLSMNPACAEAWKLMGKLSSESFAFDAAEQIAERLRAVAARLGDSAGGPAFSADANILIARVRLHQNAPDDAAEALAPVLSRFPKHREALALQAAAEALRFDFDKLEQRLKEFDALSGECASSAPPTALFEAGVALSIARQYDRAAELLNRAATRSPNIPEPLVELGLLLVQAGRDSEAKDVLTRATKLDPFHFRAQNSLTLVTELAGYERVEGEHFIVRYHPGVDEVVAREMLVPLEEMHKIVCTTFKHEPPGKTIIELMPDHEWFAVRITGVPDVHTIAAATGPLVAMEAPRTGPRHFGEYDWVRVVRHEFTHTVTLSRTHNRIPHWFTEAAAVQMELSPRDEDTCRLLVKCLLDDSLFDLRSINEAFARPKKPTDRQQAYMQGNWMYRFILDKWGGDAPLELMDLFAKGQREKEAFPAVLHVTTDEFMDQFKQWAAVDAAKWGLLPSPTLDELRLKAMLSDQAERSGLGERLVEISSTIAAAAADALPIGRRGLGVSLELAPPFPDQVKAWLVDHPEHPDLLELQVLDTLNAAGGEPDASMADLLEKYAAACPIDPMPHRHLARLALASSDPSKAIPHLEYLDAREQYSTTYAATLAKLYVAAGDLDKAWEKITRATRIAPYDAALREQAATIALRRKQPRDAERHILALIALEPQQEIHRKRLEAVRKMIDAAG